MTTPAPDDDRDRDSGPEFPPSPRLTSAAVVWLGVAVVLLVIVALLIIARTA